MIVYVGQMSSANTFTSRLRTKPAKLENERMNSIYCHTLINKDYTGKLGVGYLYSYEYFYDRV